MVTAMTAFKHSKKSLYLLSVLLLAACQPSPSNDEPVTSENEEAAETPLVITIDSVTMTPEHILSIKPSRYQPSLGLQGNIEPIKQTKLIAVHPINIEKMLVNEGQWVEKGMPLLTVRRIATVSNTVKSEASEKESSSEESIEVNATKNAKTENAQKSDGKLSSKSTQTASSDDVADVKIPANDKEALEAKSITDSNASNADSNSAEDNATKPTPQYNLVTINASFSGRVENLYAKTGQKMAARAPLLQLSDETKLHFMATLPIQAEPQLSVGQTVNFTTEGITDKFTGQVSKLVPTSQPKKLLVYVNVIDNEVSRDKLLPEMKVTGRVNYGQIDVGTIVPKRALHDVDLTELQKPPYMPLRPLTANVWIIGQDQRLTRQPIEVVEYDPTTQQYLIAGVSNDSLICLADLPIDSQGKKVIVS
jgi:multidrug efflux pump subunit AcrA (membrane-fusion protein)